MRDHVRGEAAERRAPITSLADSDPDGELAWREIDGVDGAVRFFRE